MNFLMCTCAGGLSFIQQFKLCSTARTSKSLRLDGHLIVVRLTLIDVAFELMHCSPERKTGDKLREKLFVGDSRLG